MRDFLADIEPVKVDTEYGALFLAPTGEKSLRVAAPVLVVEGKQCTASAFLVSADGLNFTFIQEFDRSRGQLSRAKQAIEARFVDGQEVDLVTLGKISEAVIAAVSWLAQINRAVFLESRRREINNEIAALEREIHHCQNKLEDKEKQLAEIEETLSKNEL